MAEESRSAAYHGVPYVRERIGAEAMRQRIARLREEAMQRRSVRQFAPDPIPLDVVRTAIEIASSAPSGANMQPWKFILVTDPQMKRRIREAAEEEERTNYSGRMTDEWLAVLAPLGTDWRKEFLEIAPALIVVFKEDYHIEDGRLVHHYYVNESVGIACGFLLAALNAAGLATLTHTPSPMGFLREILDRPKNEKAYLLIPVGYSAPDALVPAIRKKRLDEVIVER